MIIRQAQPNDLQALVGFNQAMAQETEGKALDTDILTSGVSAMLSDSNKGFYLVAEQQDGEIAGSLMVTYEWSDWRNSQFWWVQSVYVRPENRRTGIYSMLYQKVQELAEQTDGVCGYRLYVEKENVIAQATYEKLGMGQSHYFMYESK
ncbi:GNAT family N-acetyltransferase [Aliiglaciecola sp. LCG003]|uniref:GNAT family N-acetyltransferase n=1 Tax=Aliiglaciecola sp. LCG003 TaxID=3053655 RepID=UPI002573F493|nr:GNAT family N-acetyltransferase [Aliiglaciecola sp. LCG003]WJG08126.1 GNAT family N-acetyltransferase [Aliiglaciecola sp. LCG003]